MALERGPDPTTFTGSITDAERAAFAELSGDHNPIHTDPVAARRLLGGRMLVHGAHLLIGTLDRLCAAGAITRTPRSIDGRFVHGVQPGDELTGRWVADDHGDLRATLTADVWDAMEVTIVPGDLAASTRALVGGTPPHTAPAVVGLDDLADRSGAIEIAGDSQAVTDLFPHAVDVFGAERVLEIALLSQVVGMHAPGLRSMSARYRISFEPSDIPARLAFAVERVDKRIARATIRANGPSVAATIDAFAPPPPVDTVGLLDVRARQSEFTGTRALVVGGSRGLGAATVALLAAGGADVRFTYRVGEPQAEAMAAATGATGFRVDARQPNATVDAVTGDDWHPTMLAWFATPPYSGGTGRAYSQRLRDDLLAVQVTAFEEMVDLLCSTRPPGGLSAVIWPSSALIDSPTPDTRERVDVALAGEAAAGRLVNRWPGLTVHAPRLPTMLTDQTVSLLPVEYADPAEHLRQALRTALADTA